MANRAHLALLKKSIQTWNAWRASNPTIVPDLRDADLAHADLRGANLFRTHLEGANLNGVQFSGANLRETHLEGTNLQDAWFASGFPPSFSGLDWEMSYYASPPPDQMKPASDSVILAADLRHAFFDSATNLTDIILTHNELDGIEQYHCSAFLADVVWNDVNLAVVDWTQLNQLGDELLIQAQLGRENALQMHRAAVRAYRQLGTVLQSQGLNEAASHYIYRAKVLERRLFLKEIRLPSILQATIEGNEQIRWDWKRVVQGDIRVYLGEPARHRKQAHSFAFAWQFLLMVILMIPLAQGSLAWGMIRLLWLHLPWRKCKENIIEFFGYASSWLVPVLVLILLLPPLLMAFLLFPSFQSGWEPIVPISIRGWLSLAAVFATFYCLVIVAYFWQIYQALQAYRAVEKKEDGKGVYMPRVSKLLFDRLYWHLMMINEAIRGSTRYLFSLFLDMFSGYGYKLGRSFCAYLSIIIVFAFAYHTLDSHLEWKDAFTISMFAFHGRGFSFFQFQPSEPQSLVSALEAFVGLIMEVTFIATLTQRFFEK